MLKKRLVAAAWIGVFCAIAVGPAFGDSSCGPDGVQDSGSIYRICMPAQWDGKRAVIYLHGYVAPTEPVGIPD